jgi:CopG family nickel-responsive transcriptional regulator
MSTIKRFGVSVEAKLLAEFDALMKERGYTNRSEVVRDMMRAYILERRAETADAEMIGTITLVYDHHTPGTGSRLTSLQHDYESHILSNSHVHINHYDCLEVIVARGNPKDIAVLADRMTSVRGVKYCKYVLAAAI